MAVASSVLKEESAQIDGRHWVEETHVDHLGKAHVYHWLADPGTDADQVMTDRAVMLPDEWKANEIAANVALIMELGSLADPTLDHSTVTENFAVLREAYKTALHLEAVMAGDFLSSQSDAVLRNVFNMTQAQVTNLRANKLTPAAATAADIRASSGV